MLPKNVGIVGLPLYSWMQLTSGRAKQNVCRERTLLRGRASKGAQFTNNCGDKFVRLMFLAVNILQALIIARALIYHRFVVCVCVSEGTIFILASFSILRLCSQIDRARPPRWSVIVELINGQCQ